MHQHSSQGSGSQPVGDLTLANTSSDGSYTAKELLIELVSNCNLRCKMCAYIADFTKDRMPPSWIRGVLTDVRRLRDAESPYQFDRIRLDGNSEPLLAHDLGSMIHAAKEAGIAHSNITTNGILLTAEVSRELLAAGLSTIDISMTGIVPEVYRDFQGSYLSDAQCQENIERIQRNVRDFLSIRREMGARTELTMRYIVSERSQHHFHNYLGYFRALGVDGVLLMTFCANTTLRAHPAPLARVRGRKRCEAPNHPIVRANGDVLFASCAFDIPTLGNLNQESFYDILTSEAAVRYIRGMETVDVDDMPVGCASCYGTHVY